MLTSTPLNEDLIDQAIMMSTLSGNPEYATGIWWACGPIVMPKRILLAVLMSTCNQYMSHSSCTLVLYQHLNDVIDQLPIHRRHPTLCRQADFDAGLSPNTWINDLARAACATYSHNLNASQWADPECVVTSLPGHLLRIFGTAETESA